MIEVTAFLNRGSAYLAGEALQCTINFLNSSLPGKNLAGGADTLAWASAQVHCQCTIQEQSVLGPKIRDLPASSTGMTYFYPTKGEEGSTVFATEPKIIFCDLRLAPGESKTYTYQQQLPRDAVPSFKGRCVKYAYKVTIGTQRPDSPIKLLRIPFRVMLIPGIENLNISTDRNQDLKPSNPFLASRSHDARGAEHADGTADGEALLDVALQALSLVTARRSPHYYNISNAKGKVGKFCIFKHSYKIGDDVIGTVDFSDATVPCLQFSASLQSEERVLEREASPAPNGLRVDSSVGVLHVSCHSKHEEFGLHARRTNFSLPIPITVTPGFATDVGQYTVHLRWRLHFEFVTVASPVASTSVSSPGDEGVVEWKGRTELVAETTEWDLPLKVFATSPLLCSSTPCSLASAEACVTV